VSAAPGSVPPGRRPLRVLVMTVAHPPQDARIRARQVGALRASGHEVTYLAPFAAFGLDPAVDVPEVTPVDVPRAVGLQRSWALVGAARRALPLVRDHDVVLAHDPELVPLLLLLRRWAPRTAVVWDVHEDVPAQAHMAPGVPDPLRRPLAAALSLLERVAERRLHLLLAEHGYVGRFRRRHPVVPNTPRVPAEVPAPVAPTGARPHRVVYVGALTRARGLEEMVALAARLPDDMRLELVGNASPAVEARLREEAAASGGALDHRGFVPNDEALARLPGAVAGLVLLHDHANYAHSRFTKVMEYMAYGVPVVVTPNPEAARLVTEAGAGVVVGFHDVDAVLQAVVALRDDAGARRRMGAAGRATAAADHNWAVDGEDFVRLLEGWARRDR